MKTANLKTKKELMKLTKPELVDYVVTTVGGLERNRNWQRVKKEKYQSLCAAAVKDQVEGYVLREDYDRLRKMKDNQDKRVMGLLGQVATLKAALKEVL